MARPVASSSRNTAATVAWAGGNCMIRLATYPCPTGPTRGVGSRERLWRELGCCLRFPLPGWLGCQVGGLAEGDVPSGWVRGDALGQRGHIGGCAAENRCRPDWRHSRVRRVTTAGANLFPYPPLNVQVHTPTLSLLGATDELLARLVPIVRKGIATGPPWPFDDPMSLYKDNPEREWGWLRGLWAGRGRVSDSFWRLYLVVVVDGEPVGMQDLTGRNFSAFGTVTSFSWLSPDVRGRGLGREMRQAVLHLAFEGWSSRGRKRRFLRQPRVQSDLGRCWLRAQRL
jgi:RimJ/RimL family protein N-acetyltransferase